MTPLLCLHGFLGAPSSFDRTLAGLPGVRADRLTLPGHGMPPNFDYPGTFEGIVAAVAETLREPSIVVGYSMGGRVGLALALSYPERVLSAVLVGAGAGLAADARTARASWEEDQAGDLLEFGLPAFVDDWERLPLFASQTALPDKIYAEERARRTSHDPAGLAWALRALGLSRQPDLTPRLAGLSVPVTLMAGSLDEKFVESNRRIAMASPLLDARVVEGAGHNLLLEAPDAVAETIRAHLRAMEFEKKRSAP